MIMPFGKYRGYDVEKINSSYLEWLIEHIPLRGLLRSTVVAILNESDIVPVQRSVDLLLVKQTYRRLSLKYHPDRGGSTIAQTALNEFYGALSVR